MERRLAAMLAARVVSEGGPTKIPRVGWEGKMKARNPVLLFAAALLLSSCQTTSNNQTSVEGTARRTYESSGQSLGR